MCEQCVNTPMAVLTPGVLTPHIAVLTPPLTQDFCINVKTGTLGRFSLVVDSEERII